MYMAHYMLFVFIITNIVFENTDQTIFISLFYFRTEFFFWAGVWLCILLWLILS